MLWVATSVYIVLFFIQQTKETKAEQTEQTRTHNESLELLRSVGFIQSDEIFRVMAQVDVALFPSLGDDLNFLDCSVMDGPLPMYAYALETLRTFIQEGSRVLNVAGWSGYLTACMGLMVGKTGKVVTVRYNIDDVNETISAHLPLLLEEQRVILIERDTRVGAPEHGPYDAICGGFLAADEPEKLLEQLKPGGRMMMLEANAEESRTVAIFSKYADGGVMKHLPSTPFDAPEN